jgi:hypothetical protein
VPYTAEVSRTNPSCFLFLIDQSASMVDTIGEARLRKSDMVADSLNRLLTEVAIRCAKEEGVRDYFHASVLGYGGRSVQSALSGALQGHDLVVIADNVRFAEGAVAEGDDFFICTDAMAAWFIACVEDGGRPWETLRDLTETGFAEWVSEARRTDGLHNDDVTLVHMDVW